MTAWRRYLRYALAVFIVGLGAAVLFGLRDRADPVPAVVVERADPDAVIQTRGSRIVQADATGENLSVVANQQLTYADGSIRMLDGVQVTVAEREGRPGFVLTGNEASVDENQTAVELSGAVTFSSEDGLEAATEHASYLDAEGTVRMPGEATFTREGMRATGRGADYDRSHDLLRLLDAAQVDLTTDDARTRIRSGSATLAQTEGYMEFEGGVDIDAGTRQMQAERARVSFRDDTSDLEALELLGGSWIRGDSRVAGELREMSATAITLAYGESGQQIEQAVLVGRAVVELYGADGALGARISSQSIDVGVGAGRRRRALGGDPKRRGARSASHADATDPTHQGRDPTYDWRHGGRVGGRGIRWGRRVPRDAAARRCGADADRARRPARCHR